MTDTRINRLYGLFKEAFVDERGRLVIKAIEHTSKVMMSGYFYFTDKRITDAALQLINYPYAVKKVTFQTPMETNELQSLDIDYYSSNNSEFRTIVIMKIPASEDLPESQRVHITYIHKKDPNIVDVTMLSRGCILDHLERALEGLA